MRHFDASSTALPAHPAPKRGRVGKGTLGFGLLAGPGAWAVQFLSGYVLSGPVCSSSRIDAALAGTEPMLWTAMAVISLIAILVALVAAWVAWRAWWLTRSEAGGAANHHHLLEVGEGRTRFLAMAGILASVMFLVALIFTSANLLLVPLCR